MHSEAPFTRVRSELKMTLKSHAHDKTRVAFLNRQCEIDENGNLVSVMLTLNPVIFTPLY